MKIPIVADLHLHTVSSGHAYSTIEEYARRAKKIGLKFIAMTDHGPAMPGAPHLYHFSNIKMVPQELEGVRILRGAEANIINEKGEFDIPNKILEMLEFVLFTFHPKCGYENGGEGKNTEIMIRAMDNPYVNAIAHLENAQYPVDYEKVVREAHARNILIEVNNSSYISRPGTRDSSVKVLQAVKKFGAKVCLGTDSHISTMVGKFEYALGLIDEVQIKPEDIVNTSEESIRRFILEKRK